MLKKLKVKRIVCDFSQNMRDHETWYFHLISGDTTKSTPKVFFTFEQPTNAKWRSSPIEVNCKPTNPIQLVITSDVIFDHNRQLPWAGRSTMGISVPLMKSVIQKAIRRSRSNVAVVWSWQLLKKNATAFFRRLPIYIMEDALLHPDFSWAVWMMVATSKGWIPSAADVRRCLRIVYECALCPFHEHIQKSLPPGCPEPHFSYDDAKVPTFHTDSLALLIRRTYGGMKGDQDFLRAFAAIWRKRCMDQWSSFINTEWIATLRENAEVLCYNLPFERLSVNDAHMLLVGVDFHCFPFMVRHIQERVTHTGTRDNIRRTIWFHSSGVYLQKDGKTPKRFITSAESVTGPPDFSGDECFSHPQNDEYVETLSVWNRIKKDVRLYQAEKWKEEARQKAQPSIVHFFKRRKTDHGSNKE